MFECGEVYDRVRRAPSVDCASSGDLRYRGEMESAQPEIENPAAIRRALRRWFAAHGRDLPWRRNLDPYAVLVSEFMLQQTQVAAVIPYFERWMAALPTVRDAAKADEQTVLRLWQGLGYYSRARNLRRAAAAIVERFGGTVPSEPAALRTLPGVGAYTAAAVAAFAFDRPEPVVDGNVTRVLARLGNFTAPVRSARARQWLRSAAQSLMPRGPRGGRVAASALMELGAAVCLPRTPLCGECPVRRYCAAEQPAAIPVLVRRPRSERVAEAAIFIRRNGCLLLEQQTGPRRTGLWRLPAPTARPDGPPLAVIDYPIMHYRIRLEVFAGAAPRRRSAVQRWIPDGDLEAVPMPSPDRKIIRRLLASAPAGSRGRDLHQHPAVANAAQHAHKQPAR